MDLIRSISLHPDARADIVAECLTHPLVETGGALFGLADLGTHAEVLMATGPGPGVVATPESLEWDGAFIAGINMMVLAESDAGMRLVGRWHRHPAHADGGRPRTVRPSRRDAMGAALLRTQLGLPAILELIVSTFTDGRPHRWAAYRADDDGFMAIPIVGEDP